jgi:2-keto-4-pentenoate hydratase/2-oxohepta-3-ene-1,7-dioic acid hydratase in catechol pathway
MRYAALRSSGQAPRFARIEIENEKNQAFLLDAAPWHGGKETGEARAFDPSHLACPVAPTKIVGIGRNYAAHARELGHDIPAEPLLFLKAPSALAGPGDAVALPPESARVEHEGELAVVIGTRAKHVSEAVALTHVLGYACACDVTARDLQRRDVQFTRAKSFDGFCPIGPWIETELSPAALTVACRVDGALRQNGSTRDMIFSVPQIVAYVSRMMTLEPGDVILTGTPEGVGPLVAGSAVEVEISGIGTLHFDMTA